MRKITLFTNPIRVVAVGVQLNPPLALYFSSHCRSSCGSRKRGVETHTDIDIKKGNMAGRRQKPDLFAEAGRSAT